MLHISTRCLKSRSIIYICKNYKFYIVIFANMEKYCYLCSRMKKRLSIIMTSLAVIFTLMAVGIHHHHHGELMCLAQQECCEQQGTHDSHHSQAENSSDHTQHYLASSIVKIHADYSVQDFHHGFGAFPLFISGKALNAPLPYLRYLKICRYFRVGAYQPWIQACRGLRAPPHVSFSFAS